MANELAPQNREAIMQEVRTQAAIVNATSLLLNISDKCFEKCITKPGTSLDTLDQKCLAQCMDRFLDSRKLVAEAYGNRLKQEQMNH